jgi:excinuclease ABC subunit C
MSKRTPPELRARLRHLPDRAGVYLMKDAEGAILYVGKAKSLRSRVRSYFTAATDASLKTRELVRRIADVDTIVTETEAEALMLENNLIKEHHPRFNINLRDDKTYPYVKVTLNERFPRVLVTRRLERDGARYFGPFTDVGRMRAALDVVRRLYTVRTCHYDLPAQAPPRPCLDYHIGRCRGPCVGLQGEEDYRGMIDEIVDILAGRTRRASVRIRGEMAEAAERLEFERAAELRDALGRLEALEARQMVVDPGGGDRDVVAVARDGDEACGVVLRIREGKVVAREAGFLSRAEDAADPALLATFATRFYGVRMDEEGVDLPREVLFAEDFEDRPLLEELLALSAGRRVQTLVPRRGPKAHVVALAGRNARHLLEERRLLEGAGKGKAAPDALFELQEVLELPFVPRRIACFDVSHTQGSETVASGVVFENGAPLKSEYRRFRIRGEWGNDDYRSMHEAVTRYLRRAREEDRPLPDLVVIDGGKGQLSAAHRALEELDLAQISMVSLAKRDEEVFRPGHADPVRLARRSVALRLLQRLRDEAHRFAVGYNRNLRTKRTVRSALAEIPGVGPARQRALLERFGSLRAVARASESEVAAVPGFGPALARVVLGHLAPPPENAPSTEEAQG